MADGAPRAAWLLASGVSREPFFLVEDGENILVVLDHVFLSWL